MLSPRPLACHRARSDRARRSRRALAVSAAGALVLAVGSVVGIGAGLAVSRGPDAPDAAPPWPSVVAALPAPEINAVDAVAPCESAPVAAAVAAGDAGATILALGGGVAFRDAVANGQLACIDLADPAQPWFVVNKQRPFAERTWAPTDLVVPTGITVLDGSALRAEAATALANLAAAVRDSGAGEIAVSSGYRSYETQVGNHEQQVAAEGQAAELSSARAGFSEHQTGLTADVVPCSPVCQGLDALGASAQGVWIAEHAWEHGWIVRYEADQTGTTGYLPEPWHLRYIGTELAQAYHEGGYRSLEDFFALPAAPDYAD